MEMALTIMLTVAVLADLVLTSVVFGKTCLPSAEERTEARVEKAMSEAREDAKEPEDDPITEGLANIMQYSVNGKDGFDDEGK